MDEWEGKVGHFKLEAPVVLFGSNDGGCELRWGRQERRENPPFPQQREERGAVAVVQEDGLAQVDAAGDVVHRVRELDTQRAGHGGGAVVAVF